MNFTIAKKEEISLATKKYLEQKDMSQSDFNRATSFPSDYLSKILNRKWENEYPKQEHFEKLADLIGFSYKKKYWQHFKTDFYEEIKGVFLVAKKECKLCGVDGFTGIGKTYALERLSRESKGNFYVKVEPSQSRLDFLENIIDTMKIKTSTRNAFKMQGLIVERLKTTKEALLILDECEYISKTHFDMIKTIYDNIKGSAGILICGFGIKELIDKKSLSTQGKKGWSQLRRRINQNWNVLPKIGRGTKEWKEIVNNLLVELVGGKVIKVYNKEKNEYIEKIIPKVFSLSAVSWLTNESENFDDLKTFVTEILIAADEDSLKVINKNYLNSYFA